MSGKLYNILVPVDFTHKNKWAIAKAIELSNSFHCNVHLVHVTGRNISIFERNDNAEISFKKMEELKALYRHQICGDGSLEISVLAGSHQKQLAKYIQEYEMDLVVTGLSKFNLLQRITSSISISRLAKKTSIPVLAVRSGGLVCHFKKIVLPYPAKYPCARYDWQHYWAELLNLLFILFLSGNMQMTGTRILLTRPSK